VVDYWAAPGGERQLEGQNLVGKDVTGVLSDVPLIAFKDADPQFYRTLLAFVRAFAPR
jgi:hypothetical protein